ncbi:MAG: NAD(P)/FAD-dependent oxidoreductase [Gammaproteobacteria bacterium]
MDKAPFPRNKVCAGWITPAVVNELQIDLHDYQRERELQAIKGFRIGYLDNETGGQETETCYDETVSYGIRRVEFDEYLLKRCGAELLLNNKVKTIEKFSDYWLVNNEIKAGVLIGAGGHFCPVARELGHKTGKNEVAVAAQEVEFEMDSQQQASCNVSETTPVLYFCHDLQGYGWVFRKGNYLNIGLGREDNYQLGEQVKTFCQFLKQQKIIEFDIEHRFQGHAYLLYNHAQRELVAERALLIGDAAGLAYPQSGEGIRPAVESALFAAQTLKDARYDFSKSKLMTYQDKMEQHFGKRQPLAGIMERMPENIRIKLACQLITRTWFARHVVMDRWFLHQHQAPVSIQ